MRDVGKGWFNLKDTNREIYEFSKLKRFLTMVNFMMEVRACVCVCLGPRLCAGCVLRLAVCGRSLVACRCAVQDTLRFAVMENLGKFQEHMLIAAEGRVTVGSTSDISIDFSGSRVDLRHRRPPLFTIEVEIVPDMSASVGGSVAKEDSVVLAEESVRALLPCGTLLPSLSLCLFPAGTCRCTFCCRNF